MSSPRSIRPPIHPSAGGPAGCWTRRHRRHWDGDLLRELTDHEWDGSHGVPAVAKWNWQTDTAEVVLRANGSQSNNGTKGNPVLQADLLGDWREELIFRTDDSSALRLFTTTDVTEHRIRTLMHDPVYRLGVAWQNVGYHQPPHPGFFIGEGMPRPAQPAIRCTR